MKFALTVLLFSLCNFLHAQEWQSMFNGKDISGWTIRGGEASYQVEGDSIIGISKGRYNTFLSTEKEYDDFILELEVFVDPTMNSGIQIRSHEDKHVFGYQVEVDPSERAWSGGLYDESRRGWLYPLTLNPSAKTAFKNGVWNAYRIEAIGTSIRIWVNGVCTSATIDDVDASGFIALQVHGIGDDVAAGKQIKWRNVRILIKDVVSFRTPLPKDMHELNLISQ